MEEQKMRAVINIISILISAFVFVPLVSGTVYYVDGINGSNGWSGETTNFTTATGPFETINYAVSQLAAGDTCWVRFTNYFEQVYGMAASGSAGNEITLKGDYTGAIWEDSTSRPIIDGENASQNCIKLRYAFWIIRNFVTHDATLRNLQVYQSGGHNNSFYNMISYGAKYGIYDEYGANDNNVYDSIFYSNDYGGFIYGYNTLKASMNFHRCKFYNNGYGLFGNFYQNVGSRSSVNSSLFVTIQVPFRQSYRMADSLLFGG